MIYFQHYIGLKRTEELPVLSLVIYEERVNSIIAHLYYVLTVEMPLFCLTYHAYAFPRNPYEEHDIKHFLKK